MFNSAGRSLCSSLRGNLFVQSVARFPLRIEHIEHFPCFKHLFLNMETRLDKQFLITQG